MPRSGYMIMDEPQPGDLARYTVHPLWPLLAMMMCGTLLAGPWVVLNAFAIGSATRRSEAWLIVGSVLAAVAFIAVFGTAMAYGGLPWSAKAAGPYVLIALAVIKLSFA